MNPTQAGPAHWSGPWQPVGTLCCALLLALPFVFFTTFNGFSAFDDEGTLMIWFRSFADGYRMYDEIYSLYGPLYSAVYGVLHGVLHVPLTHTAWRMTAAFMWLLYTAGLAVFCYRLTRSVLVLLASFVLVLVWLAPLMNSPGHPEELSLVLLAGVLLLTSGIADRRGPLVLWALGAAMAGIMLVKVNFGIFVGGAVVLTLLRASVHPLLRRTGALVAGAGLAVLPVALMALVIERDWVRSYALFATLTIWPAVLVAVVRQQRPIVAVADWLTIVVAGLLACVAVIGGMMLAGSSGRAILHTMFLQNASFIRNWSVPLQVGWLGLAAACASAILAVVALGTVGRPRWRDWHETGVTLLKTGIVLSGFVLMVFAPGQPLRLVTPFCWLLMLAPPAARPSEQLARGIAGMMGALMSLYAFPVAGTQVIIAALIPVAFLPVLALDVMRALDGRGWLGALASGRAPRVAGAAALLVLFAGATVRSGMTYGAGVPLGLPGTSLIRIAPAQAEALQWVTRQLADCEASYSVPGLASFQFWSQRPPVTPLNVNAVLNFTSHEQQNRIVMALDQVEGLCVITNPGIFAFFDRGQAALDPPLLHYIRANFHDAAAHAGFVILRRNEPVAQ